MRKALRLFAAMTLAFPAALPLRAAALGEGDLDFLARSFTGTFDSAAQYQMEVEAGLPEDECHPQTLLTHTPITASALGRHVFYVEEARGKPPKILRRRIVTLDLDKAGQSLRMKSYVLKDGAGASAAALAGLTADNVTPLAGCDIVFSLEGEIFEGEGAGKACAMPGEPDKDARYVQTRLTVSPGQVMRVERMFYADDDAPTDPRADAGLPTVHFKAMQ